MTLLRPVALLAAALVLAQPLSAQRREPAIPLSTAALAGQPVSVLPLTMLVTDPALDGDTTVAPMHERPDALRWADSLIAEVATERAPEVRWILPRALRKAARRGAGFVPDPDQMGQSVMRAPGVKRVPDPLRSNLRTLVALAGGRNVLIPAALAYSRDPDGQLRANLSLVVADARSGSVLWRSLATGAGTSPSAALRAALATVFPFDDGSAPSPGAAR